MPRPQKCRWVKGEPNVNYFKPVGIPMHSLNEVVLTVEEFEAIRLKDLEGLEQEECAEKMKVSRPTFFRIIISAREKVADALVNGKAIKVEGGNYKVYGDDTVHHGHCHRHGMDINEDE
ncbi:DUF134 domain-containing protein [Thermoanaerobacterium thermosaccharolyticum]|uniref:DUF134 domain-containing protein n=1 Tax=Thermoanaerobacterium thermosaccharolyticum TaxID=1517 RepID=UPI003DA92849